MKNLRGARIALLGLSYKPGTDDLRDSPALDIATQVIEYGAFVSAYDPVVKALPTCLPVRIASDAYAAAEGADAVVVATEWPQFLDLDFAPLRSAMKGRPALRRAQLPVTDDRRVSGFRVRGRGAACTG